MIQILKAFNEKLEGGCWTRAMKFVYNYKTKVNIILELKVEMKHKGVSEWITKKCNNK